jgi:type II secretory pathway pseudopilin PulG
MYVRKREEGFSLIEVLIATVLLCTIIPLTSYFVSSIKTNNKTELQQTANHVVQKYMEDFKAKTLADITAMVPTGAEEYTYKKVDSETGLNAHVKVKLESAEDSTVGEIKITALLGTRIKIKMGNESSDSSFNVTDNDILNLRIIKDGSVEKLQMESDSGVVLGSITLKGVTPRSAERIIKLTLIADSDAPPKKGPVITIKAKNELPPSWWVIFNIKGADDCPNFILKREGNIVNVDNVASPERGATVTIMIKDKNDSEVLAMAAQNRKI